MLSGAGKKKKGGERRATTRWDRFFDMSFKTIVATYFYVLLVLSGVLGSLLFGLMFEKLFLSKIPDPRLLHTV